MERGFELLAVPGLPTAPFLPSGADWACQLFKESNCCEKAAGGQERNNLLGFVFQGATPEPPEKTLSARRAGPWTLSISRVSGTGTPTSLGFLRNVSIFLSLTFRTPRPPLSPLLAAPPAGRSRAPAPPYERDSPARLAAAGRREGGQERGQGGPMDYAGARAPLGAGPGGTRRTAAETQSARLRPPAASPPRPRRSQEPQPPGGASGVRAQPACRRRARAAPPLPLPRRSARGASARGRRPTGARPDASRKRSRPSRANWGAGRGSGRARAHLAGTAGFAGSWAVGRWGCRAGAGLYVPDDRPFGALRVSTVARNSLSPSPVSCMCRPQE